ncbi:MAG: class I adenylate-forming enzyme family protein [Faecalibacterium sp.]
MVTSLYQSLCNMETIYADRVALRWYDEASESVSQVTYSQYARDLRRFVAGLRAKGDMEGRCVAILARNSYEYVISLYGTVLAGAVAVPMNLAKDWDEIRYELELVEPALILHDGEYLEREPALGEAFGGLLAPMDGFTAFEPAQVQEQKDLTRLAFILFTSGTTGRSKGVMLSQKIFFDAMPAFVRPFEELEKAGHDISHLDSLSVLPMFHVAPVTSLVSWSVMGYTINLCNNLKYFYRDLAAMPSDYIAVVPVLLDMIYKDVKRGRRERLGKLWMVGCGAATFDPVMLKDLADNGFYIAQMYGSTETCGDGAFNCSQKLEHLSSVGHVDDSCEYKVEGGELCIRGGCVMMGYYKDAAATAEVVDAEGWYHTGDIARVEEDGYLYLTGRKKNLIILDSGENVSPEELEKLLMGCPDITEALVKEKGKRICAVVYCPDDRQQAVQDFVTELNRSLPLYKRMVVEFSAGPLARNAAGKLVRG